VNDQFHYRRFHPHVDQDLLPELVDCYRRVFGEAPWHEWKRCTNCNQKWGRSEELTLHSLQCMHCDQPLVDFWPKEVVTADLLRKITKEASCWITLHEEKVIGFCWGYPMELTAVEERWKLPGLIESLQLSFGPLNKVACQDELGLRSEYRKKGIAKKLVRYQLDDFREQSLPVHILCTKTNPPTVTYLWYTALGYQVIAEYDDPDKRVILARSLVDLHL